VFNLDVPADDSLLLLNVITTPIVKQRKKRAPRSSVPVVLPEERRFTHSYLTDGYRTAPILKEEPKMKKKATL
jgi:hypothetical protein